MSCEDISKNTYKHVNTNTVKFHTYKVPRIGKVRKIKNRRELIKA